MGKIEYVYICPVGHGFVSIRKKKDYKEKKYIHCHFCKKYYYVDSLKRILTVMLELYIKNKKGEFNNGKTPKF